MSNSPVTIHAKAEAEVVAEVAREATRAQVVHIEHPLAPELGKVPVLFVPAHAHQPAEVRSLKKSLDEYRKTPEYREGTAELGDLDSFIAHANRFKSADSALFASPDPKQPSLTSVLDYHPAGAASPAAWGSHQGHYAFPLSDEWKRWTGRAGVTMSQADFAEFIEANITDVSDPGADLTGIAAELANALGATFAGPAKVLELSRGMHVRAGTAVKAAVNLGTGETQLSYISEHQDEKGQPLKVPNAFLVALPVFRGGAPYRLPVRLRYRLRESQITWFFELYRADRVFDAAFKEACDTAREQTELPLFVGSPE